MKSNQTTKRLGIVAAVVILAIVLFACLSSVFVLSSPSSGAAESSSAGVIDYTIKPSRITRDPAGKFMVEVDVVSKDAATWKSVAVENISITGQSSATAKLISASCCDPIPESFVLKFETDAIDSNGAKSQLHFDLAIQTTKHMGLSGGSRQKSHHIPLEPTAGE
jgi:hypothetical protein